VFQKSDAKIQIAITTAYLIRIKYPLNGFNYHLSDVNLLFVLVLVFVFQFLVLILVFENLVFTALHGMQTRYSDEKAVRPSVHLSVRQTRGL